MRVVTVSVNGLARAAEAGFFDWFEEIDADVVCVQDIRGRVYDFDDEIFHPEGFEVYFLDAENVSDGGVAIYSRRFPKAVMYGIGDPTFDAQGRFLQIDYDAVSVASVLAPSDVSSRLAFFEAFEGHLSKALRKRRPFIFAGNFCAAHQDRDASQWFQDQSADGFSQEERAFFDRIIDEQGYIDAYRSIEAKAEEHSWWPELDGMVRGDCSLRVDLQITSPTIEGSIEDGFIDMDTRFSDHAPFIVDYGLID